MNNSIDPHVAEHHDTWDLLPWYLTARVTDSDRARVEAHLQHCGECRRELAQQRQIHQAMAVDTTVEHMPAPSLQRLRLRLDAATLDERAATDSTAAGATGVTGAAGAAPRPHAFPRRALGRWAGHGSSNILAASTAAMALALGAMLVTAWTQLRPHAPPANYYTVTTAVPAVPQAAIRAVFSPAITLSELQAILDEAGLKIVAGPSEAGVYTLAINSTRPVSWSLQRLRGHAAVRFAEATGVAMMLDRAPANASGPP